MENIMIKTCLVVPPGFLSFNVHGDVPVPYQYGFQDPATEFVEGIIDLHHDVFGYMVFISIFVFYMLSATLFLFRAHYNKQPPIDIRHNTLIEIIWTIIPTIIIIIIAIPSFVLIYAMDELVGPQLTIKAVGNQWYWNYEYTDMTYRKPSLPSTYDKQSFVPSQLSRNFFFNFFNFIKFINTNSLSFFNSFFNLSKIHLFENLKPHLYYFELLICSLFLRTNYNYTDYNYNLTFLDLYIFQKRLFFNFKIINLNFFYNLYLFVKIKKFNNNNLLMNVVDYNFFGNFSNKFFSKFNFFYNSSFFIFFSGLNKYSLFFNNNWIFFYHFLINFYHHDQKSDLIFSLITLNYLSKYYWFSKLSLISAENLLSLNFFNSKSFFNSYFLLSQSYFVKNLFFWPLLLNFNKDFNIASFKDYLILFSYINPIKIPFLLKIESRMLDTSIVEASIGHKFRLLSVDRPVILPVETQIRFLTTANDVLHSWTIPSFGVKIDACPGRLNQVGIFIKREGVFYGQCSEICGVNHGFMPIEVRVYTAKDFLFWVSKNFQKYQN